ncbi:MAG TPA: hypothetical protein DCR55_01660 [Lentisphaeria bacterium]|nr:hypothetical protein [Lentisphaeria bacterium]
MSKVTAVIPCYNHGQYVDKAVTSIRAQGLDDIEIFIVDDGSTAPETISILDAYPSEKATVLRKQNGHLSSARNYGAERATGEYILGLDADDFYAPTFLKQAVEILDTRPEVGAVTSFTQNFGIRTDRHERKKGGTVTDFLTANPCNASCLYRKACWEDAGGFDETMKEGYEDWNFWLAVTTKGWAIHSIPDYLLHYYVAAQSMVVDSDKKRPALMKRLVENNPEAYRNHMAQVVYDEERKIQDLEQRLNEVRGSLAYRVGRCLTQPGTVLSGIARRLRNRSENRD